MVKHTSYVINEILTSVNGKKGVRNITSRQFYLVSSKCVYGWYIDGWHQHVMFLTHSDHSFTVSMKQLFQFKSSFLMVFTSVESFEVVKK